MRGRTLPELRLTAEMARQVERRTHDPGLPPGRRTPTEEERTAVLRALLADRPLSGEVWVFAYGSLIWNPSFDFVEQRVGVVSGWHRAFCLGWDRWFRGCEERPGLMLSLDRGGRCKGIAYRLPPDAVEANLDRLHRREVLTWPSAHYPRWLSVRTEGGDIRAITFVIDRDGGRYVGGLSVEAVADALAVATGCRGTMAEYLYTTVKHLAELGLYDSHLWRLQEMVAERLLAKGASGQPLSGLAEQSDGA